MWAQKITKIYYEEIWAQTISKNISVRRCGQWAQTISKIYYEEMWAQTISKNILLIRISGHKQYLKIYYLGYVGTNNL